MLIFIWAVLYLSGTFGFENEIVLYGETKIKGKFKILLNEKLTAGDIFVLRSTDLNGCKNDPPKVQFIADMENIPLQFEFEWGSRSLFGSPSDSLKILSKMDNVWQEKEIAQSLILFNSIFTFTDIRIQFNSESLNIFVNRKLVRTIRNPTNIFNVNQILSNDCMGYVAQFMLINGLITSTPFSTQMDVNYKETIHLMLIPVKDFQIGLVPNNESILPVYCSFNNRGEMKLSQGSDENGDSQQTKLVGLEPNSLVDVTIKYSDGVFGIYFNKHFISKIVSGLNQNDSNLRFEIQGDVTILNIEIV